MRTRLLLAFLAVTAFAVVAAAAALHAFREVGGRLEVIEARVPPALKALELSRSAERIIAAAPALLAAADRDRRDEIGAALDAQVRELEGTLDTLEGDAGQAPVAAIGAIVSALTAELAALDGVVARRLEAGARIGALRRDMFRTDAATERLLAPWLEVTERRIDAVLEAGGAGEAGAADPTGRLAPLIALQALMRAAQAQVSSVSGMLAEASTAESPRRLEILAFQLGLALDDLEVTADGLDPQLRPLFLERVDALRAFAEGADAIPEARARELALVEEGEAALAAAGRLSAQLTAAVDRLGDAASRDVGTAIGDALSVQRTSTRALLAVVALSLLTSVLVVWRYVGGNIVRRLTALSDGMLAIAGGRLHVPVAAEGGDEIAAMARAVEVFRRNTLERDALLLEKARAAERLEEEVAQRTAELDEKRRQLEHANRYKSQFLAAASHDLRQPLHALTLFAAQLRTEADPEERTRLAGRINAAVDAMNELFEGLLDMARLEAGALEPSLGAFPVAPLLARIETTFAETAREKRLRLRVVPSSAWVRSDFVLLERILLNLVANAVRNTVRGGVVVGCRRRDDRLCIEVCDSGPGIPEERLRSLSGEFAPSAARADRRAGLGLGLSIVGRLSRLLEHPLEVEVRPGRGSRFAVVVPLAAAGTEAPEPAAAPALADPAHGKHVVVIDDDALALDGMGGMLRSWGCEVVTAESGEAALAKLAAERLEPDLIISDYRLAGGTTGIEAIERLRGALGAAIPAFLVSGDTAPERLRAARERGYDLLHKPVAPMRLRAMLNRFV